MRPIIGQIENDGPADLSSLKPNDVVLKINNSKIYYASDIRSVISPIPNQDVQIDVRRGSDIISFPVKLGVFKDQSGQDLGMLGISFGTNRTLVQAVSKGVFETYNLKY